LTIKTESLHINEQSRALSGTILETFLVFLISYTILFVGMSLTPNIFDEAIMLTGPMRVLAGQIPHRDFFVNYGPGQFYTIAGLFKLFGESILVERLYDLFLKGLIVALVYRTVSSYCRRSIAVWAAAVMILWFFGLNEMAGNALVPVSLLNLVGSLLILPVFLRPVSTKRMLAAGAVAGMAALFRYDTGIALLGTQAIVVAIAIYLRVSVSQNRLRNFASTFWPYLAGFAVVTLPALFYYLSRAPFASFAHDILIYPSKYYYRTRNLPFPGIHLKGLDKLGVYLPIAVIVILLCVAVARRSGTSEMDAFSATPAEQTWRGFLITFGFLALVMYFKGIVRVSLIHMYLSILPSLLLIAILFQHRMTFTRPIRICITIVCWFFVFAAGLSSLREIRFLHIRDTFLPRSIWLSARGALPEMRATWCKNENPLTKGLCFFPDNDHIQTIEFIRSHTRPDQKLLVGLTRHDIVFANDNLIYFATQRLPVTKWSQFDPDLVNRYDIQTQIVHDLEVNAPPYIVLDSEYDSTREPNESSNSSGVTLLDEYIRNKYQRVETFGELFVWQRIRTP
jgi:Dolichyl-phosphate-mannose-protein mannosyltransferase